MSRYALDSYAILAFLQGEEGAERVKYLLSAARAGEAELHMSVINLAEVQYKIMRRGADTTDALALLRTLPISLISADEHISEVVQLKAKYPMSLADCFAAALAQELDCPLLTGDPEFKKIEQIIQIEWI